jgi:hypothetical protein
VVVRAARYVAIVCIAILAVITLLVIADRKHIFQEGNPLLLLPTFAELRGDGVEIAPAPHNARLLIGRGGRSNREALDATLAAKGWRFYEQHGAQRWYTNGHDRLRVWCRIYLHGRYWAYELDRDP